MESTSAAVLHEMQEWRLRSAKPYADPFNEITLDVVFRGEGGEWRVPAFWAGGDEWRVRFAAPSTGEYCFETVCSDTVNTDLHGKRGTLSAAPYSGDNPLLKRGGIRVSADARRFEWADGTPFFWLGDTWWMGLSKRLSWPEEFQALAADRVRKGFTVVQIIAGLYPDMPAFDERGANEAGFPWEEGYARINPEYFDRADERIAWLVRSGLVPCIVGCWAYFLPWMGVEKLKQHWRYIVARWGAYPVTWCMAGEAAMPYYLSQNKEADREAQRVGWADVARYVREIDCWKRPITIHPSSSGRMEVADESVLDYDMLQTGHGGYKSVSNTVKKVIEQRDREPAMPVVVGEVSYEGILHGTQDEVQRLNFWASFLSGAAGFTYGANGIWQVNTASKPYGASPHGATWGNTPWDVAAQLPGSGQLGLARRLLERYPWQRFEPHQEWVCPAGDPANVDLPFAAGIPGEVRVIYFYEPTYPWSGAPPRVTAIEPDVDYHAYFFDPRTGDTHALGKVAPDASGCWQIPLQPELKDWVLVMEKKGS